MTTRTPLAPTTLPTHTRTLRPSRPHPANPTTSSGRRVNRQWPCPSHNQLLAAPLHYPLLPPDLSRATHPVTASTTANANATTITCSTMVFFGTDEGRSSRLSRRSATRTKPEQAAQRWHQVHYQGAKQHLLGKATISHLATSMAVATLQTL